jgi:hypothetical protein
MRRRAPDELVRPYRERVARPEGEQVRRRLAAWVHRHGDGIPEAPELPAGVTDRLMLRCFAGRPTTSPRTLAIETSR